MSRRDPLRKLLEEHLPVESSERLYVDDMLTLLDSPGDPFSRDHFDPGHFTASAFLLSPSLDSLLLILHGKLHRWLQPGGHVDPSDSNPLDAACRELEEETGIRSHEPLTSGLFDVDIHSIPARAQEPEHRHFDLRFAFVAKNLDVQAASDATDAQWVKLDEIHTVESDASVMRAVAKLRNWSPKWTTTTVPRTSRVSETSPPVRRN